MCKSIHLTLLGLRIIVEFETGKDSGRPEYFHNYIRKTYASYISHDKTKPVCTITYQSEPDYIHMIQKGDRFFSECYQKTENGYRIYYHADIIFFDILLRTLILDHLSKTGGFIMHASSIVVNDKVYLFSAPSGTGKSTLAQSLKDEFRLFSDDLVCIRRNPQGEYLAYQYPPPERNNMPKAPEGYPCGGVLLLKRSTAADIQSVALSEKTVALMTRCLFTEKQYLKKNLETLFNFIHVGGAFHIFKLGSIAENKTYIKRYLAY